MKKTILTLLMMTLGTTMGCLAQHVNPLLDEWRTPFQTPPFGEIQTYHYKPAVQEAMKMHREAVEAIVRQKAAPTFENTIEALETAGVMLERVTGLLFNMNECYTNEELQQVVLDISPELTRHYNAINMDERLFARVRKLYERREGLGLNAEQMRLLERTYQGFVRSGALLDKRQKKAFAERSEQLSKLQQRFNQNVLADDNAFCLHIEKRESLAGLPQSFIDAAAQEAERRGLKGWVVTLKAPSYRPFMMYSENRNLRHVAWMAYNSRANHANDSDNNEIVREIVRLRAEKAKMLGYQDYASYVLDDRMAKDVPTVRAFMQRLIDVAQPQAESEYNALCRYAQERGLPSQVMPWDFSFYAEKMRKERYDIDAEMLRAYFPVDSVVRGIFGLYGRLYGLTFKENSAIPVYQPEVKAYEVHDGERVMGVLYLDLYPNEGKRGGAWKTDFRSQSNMAYFKERGIDRPLVQIVCNFSKPVGDAPALLSFDEVETFMHEFGHAIHNLLSDVTYPSLSGTATLRDFVELPSQVMENWCYEPEFLNTFARHYQTGELIPAEYVRKLKAAENFLAGWYTIRQINFGLADLAYHTVDSVVSDRIEVFEHENIITLMNEPKGTCFSTAFSHIFSGGYASGYYGYKWAEVLDADVFSAFKRAGIFDEQTARRFRETILSRGGTKHPADMFRDFMGRDPNPDALIERCGFVQPRANADR